MGNRPEFLFVWFGLSKLGAIEVPVNTAHRGELLTYMMDKSDAKMLVMEAGFMDRVAPVLKDLPKLEQVIVLAEPEDRVPALEKPVLDYPRVVDNDGVFKAPSVTLVRPLCGHVYQRHHRTQQGVPHAPELCPVHGKGLHGDGRVYGKRLPLQHPSPVSRKCPASLHHAGPHERRPHGAGGAVFRQPVLAGGKKYGCTEFNYIGGFCPSCLRRNRNLTMRITPCGSCLAVAVRRTFLKRWRPGSA